MQFYLYDFSAMLSGDVNSGGFFDHEMHLDSYWSEPDRFPYLIYTNSEIAGFLLVNSYTCLAENRGGKSIAEFFVMPKYRRRGVGRKTAIQIFDKFPGKWEVRQIKENIAGQLFWRKVIAEYTRGNFKETVLNDHLWQGPVQYFDTSK